MTIHKEESEQDLNTFYFYLVVNHPEVPQGEGDVSIVQEPIGSQKKGKRLFGDDYVELGSGTEVVYIGSETFNNPADGQYRNQVVARMMSQLDDIVLLNAGIDPKKYAKS